MTFQIQFNYSEEQMMRFLKCHGYVVRKEIVHMTSYDELGTNASEEEVYGVFGFKDNKYFPFEKPDKEYFDKHDWLIAAFTKQFNESILYAASNVRLRSTEFDGPLKAPLYDRTHV